MDMQKEREAFEAWLFDEFSGAVNFDIVFCEHEKKYNHVPTQARWEAWQAAKASAVPEGRTDFEIIEQTIAIVDLLADANRFKRDKSKPFPFESENPRNIEWWRVACQIQELLTDTDPNNCDFEEYKAMIEVAQEQGHE